MDIAAFVIALLAFVMASANLIIYLSKNVFSSHTIQMQPIDDLFSGIPKQGHALPDSFEEFDGPSAVDLAMKEQFRKHGK